MIVVTGGDVRANSRPLSTSIWYPSFVKGEIQDIMHIFSNKPHPIVADMVSPGGRIDHHDIPGKFGMRLEADSETIGLDKKMQHSIIQEKNSFPLFLPTMF